MVRSATLITESIQWFRERIPVAGHIIAPGDGFVIDFPGTVNLACDFDMFFVRSLDAFMIVFPTEIPCCFVAEFLKIVNLACNATEDGNGLAAFLRIGRKLLLRLRLEEESGEMSCRELKPDLGELCTVNFAQVIGKIVLEEVSFEGAILLEPPGFVTAMGFPI